MIESDYFARKRAELGLDRVDDLARVQAALDAWYPGLARARQLHRGTLRVVTPSSSVASELRMRQLELAQIVGLEDVRIAVSIGSIS
ncbi:MAG TPA: hypothetical protein VGH44_04180 [Candidatus Saccharimonadia bacterium]